VVRKMEGGNRASSFVSFGTDFSTDVSVLKLPLRGERIKIRRVSGVGGAE
jgi:hypothetical protein